MDTKEHESTPLYSALKKYSKEKIVHFDVPGHKKNVESPLTKAFGERVVLCDANSTKELDMLSNPHGIILEAQKLMAQAYQADNAFFLVNGSTFGVQVMIMSTCSPNDKIIIPRNVHKSVINGIILSGAKPVFLQPEIDTEYGIANGVTVSSVKKAISENTDAKAIFLINPTYFGVVSNLKEIIDICHEKSIVVLVDEAHGAHFPFHEDLPSSAIKLGADMSTISMHKTCGSLTQSSVLFHNNGLIELESIKQTINLMQTTSASYLLLASLDIARKNLVLNGNNFYSNILKVIRIAVEELNNTLGIKVITRKYVHEKQIFGFDETKLVIKVNELGLNGFEVYDILKADYNIQMELAESYVVLAVIGIGDTAESIFKLVKCFKDLSRRYYGKKPRFTTSIGNFFDKPKAVISPRTAYYSKKNTVNINNSLGEIAGESIMIYPPGIPLIIPGERITKNVIANYNFYLKQHCVMMSSLSELGSIKVLGEE